MDDRFKFRVWDDKHPTIGTTFFYSAHVGLWDFWNWIASHGNDLKKVQQFTGKKDKNKQDIYEGDIVEYSSSRDGVFFHAEVYYDNKTARFKVKGKQYNLDLYDMNDYYGSYKVVGNIFEHRKLIDND